MRGAILWLLGLTVALLATTPGPAYAQDEPVRALQITFDLGEYSPGFGDWTIAAVEVRGDLVGGDDVTVVLWGADNVVLWSATAPAEDPVTRFAVDDPIAVGAVMEAGASQALVTSVGGIVIGGELDLTPRAPAVGPTADDDPEAEEAPGVAGVEGSQVSRPRVAWSAAGGGAGKAQLALSMVLAVIVVAVLFRTPLPSSSSDRWTR